MSLVFQRLLSPDPLAGFGNCGFEERDSNAITPPRMLSAVTTCCAVIVVIYSLAKAAVTISLPDGTIRGTYSVPVGYYGLLQNSTSGSPYPDPPYTLEADVYDADGNQLLAEVTSSAIPFSINTPFATITGDSNSDAALGFDCTAPYECDGVIYADLDASLTSGSPVPEPSTWAMMALGFAGLGFAGYWTSRRPAESAA